MTRTSTWLATLALGLGLTSTAMAGDDNGNFMIRLQGTSLVTQDKTKSLTLNGANIQPAYDASVSNEVIPTATLTYFFNKNLAVELLCCFAKHEIDLSGPVNGKVGSMWIFPPALTLQYHFTGMGAFKPYVGAGAQYIHYFKEKGGPAATTLAAQDLSLSDSFGPVIQAGFDLGLGGGWVLNADIKKSWLDTKATWSGTNTVVGKVDVDPLVLSAGLGYRFNLDDIFGRRSAAPLK